MSDHKAEIAKAVADSVMSTYTSVTCARPACGRSLAVDTAADGTDILPIVAEREGWLGLTSGWYCPCCRSPDCPH